MSSGLLRVHTLRSLGKEMYQHLDEGDKACLQNAGLLEMPDTSLSLRIFY